MEQVKKNTTKHWAFFAFWTIVMFVVMFSPYGQWFWLILPFVATEFALAMDIL
jgi:hypothetical protein